MLLLRAGKCMLSAPPCKPSQVNREGKGPDSVSEVKEDGGS